jgi:mono/diheme cytochrome c family protein
MFRTNERRVPHAARIGIWTCALALFAVGCRQRMNDQPHFEPLEASSFFADGMSSRPLVEGTVARGHLRLDEQFYTGKVNGKLAEDLPAKALENRTTEDLLLRGRERFDIFCAPCHGRLGNGDGMVVRRGFPRPPSYHIDRLRSAPLGHFFDVATNGFGRMPSYADQVPPEDRWAIVSYIRALQLSQNAPVSELPEEDRNALRKVAE